MKARVLGLVVLTALLGSAPSHATSIITPAGTALGFSLSEVIKGLPASVVFGAAVNSDHNIIFNDGSRNYVIADVDNQVFSSPGTVLTSAAFGAAPSAFAVANGSIWASGIGFWNLNNDGSVNTDYSASIPAWYGMSTNPVTGHIVAFGQPGLIDIDVSSGTPTYTVIKGGVTADGVAVSPDGTKAYLGYEFSNIVDLIDPTHPVSSFGVVGGIDGLVVIASNNALNGSIVVGTTVGNIVLVDPNTHAQTVLATGGNADYVSPDPTTGTLLLGSGNSMIRLSCGPGCGFSPVPEPASAGLVALGLAGLGALGWGRKSA